MPAGATRIERVCNPPARSWEHIRKRNRRNRIGGNFATPGHHRTGSKGCRGCGTGPTITFLPTMSAQKKLRKPDGPNRLPANIGGIELRDAIRRFSAAA
jgi:hypothetical protein